MSYQEQAQQYTDTSKRDRYIACIREQALTYASDPDPEISGLGRAIVGGSGPDIDAVVASLCFGPNWATLEDDGGLLSAVQTAWPIVADALHPEVA